jgi:16S rRNA U516 pseudouridylate synthase RsuA-like enzyme
MLLAFHKPYGVLSQFTPEPGSRWRPLADFGLPPGVYALGRLDADSEGLLLLSDEPGLNSRLLDPEHAHPREYWAQVERVPAGSPGSSRRPTSRRATRRSASAKACPTAGSASHSPRARTVRSGA